MGHGMDFLYGEDVQAEEDMIEMEREWAGELYRNVVNAAAYRHGINKKAKVGVTIHCAWCGTPIKKKSYQTQFCSNKGKGNCKDKFWNNIDPSRGERKRRRG